VRLVLLFALALCAPCHAGDDPIALLEAATRDSDRGVRFAAVEALGKAGTGTDAVVAALDDPEWCVRQAAARALAAIGTPAIPHLERIYKSNKTSDRLMVVETARRIGADGSPLVVGALHDADTSVLLEALGGVWLLGKDNLRADPLPRLRQLVKSNDVTVRVKACLALASIEPASRSGIRRDHMDDLNAMIAEKSKLGQTLDLLRQTWAEPAPAPPQLDLLAHMASLDQVHRSRALRRYRAAGAALEKHAEKLAELLEHDDPVLASDAALALELVGVRATADVLDHGPVRAAYFCSAAPLSDLRLVQRMLATKLSDTDLGYWVLLLGRMSVRDEDTTHLLRQAAEHSNDRVRALGVWGLGRIGVAVPEALGDRSPVVREMAARHVTSVHRLTSIAGGDHREARILAVRRLGELKRYEPLLALKKHGDPLVRIAVAQALGARCPAAMAQDVERDVRIAVASVSDGPVLLELLGDTNWRVRAAAVRSLGRTKQGAEQAAEELAPLLGSRNFTIGVAAFGALKRIGGSGALAVGWAVQRGNEAVWHYAPELFESYGAAGIGGVGPLVSALRHKSPTAREAAARCIAGVGPAAVLASPALVTALADRRLGVISHASLALGRLGVSEALFGALRHKRARVRAYAAFAIGWALGAKRGIDQVVYEPRLPVLDCGEPDPGLTRADLAGLVNLKPHEQSRLFLRGLRSRDPAIAYPCVAQLDYDQLNAWECERAVELVIAEGFRAGNKFNFSHFRSYIGSNELPACLQMMMYARRCTPGRRSIYGDLHRSARSENIPALLWFERNEIVFKRDGFGNLWQPFYNSARFRKQRLPEGLWKEIESHRALWAPDRWWLESEPVPEEREALLIEIATRSHEPPVESLPRGHRRSALRALGRARGAGSLRYLRWEAQDGERLALSSLVRRDDPEATIRLVEMARTDDVARGLLLEVRPALGRVILRELLADSATARRCAVEMRGVDRFDRSAFGMHWDPNTFLGIEPALPLAVLGRAALEAIMAGVPGCHTRRVAHALLDRIEDEGLPGEWEDTKFTAAATLDEAAPLRFRSLLRESKRPYAMELLARIRDPLDASRVAQWVAAGKDEGEDASGWWHPAISKAIVGATDTESTNRVLAQTGLYFECDNELPQFEAAVLRGDGLEALRKLLADRVDLSWRSYQPDGGPRWPWMKDALQRRCDAREYGRLDQHLGQLATWDDRARHEYWSIMRAGRYRWIVDWEETHAMTLGFDFATVPHWAEELDSNCCRISGRVAGMFEHLFEGTDELYSRADHGIAQPPSERVRDWFEFYGGDMRWSPILRRFIPKPE